MPTKTLTIATLGLICITVLSSHIPININDLAATAQISKNSGQNKKAVRYTKSISPKNQIHLNAPTFSPLSSIPKTNFSPIKLLESLKISPETKQVGETKKTIETNPETIQKDSFIAPAITPRNPSLGVINILCTIESISKNGSVTKKSISSSGIVVSNTGLILTNAHVGIHPFLAEYKSAPFVPTCKIRDSSPARELGDVSFIYISPTWTKKHPGEIQGIISSDTGNHDFAVLRANPATIFPKVKVVDIRHTGAINPLFLFGTSPDTISFQGNLSVGQRITSISYPILSANINSLYENSSTLTIHDLFAFSSAHTFHDLIETSPTVAAISGSSGGGIFDSDNNLIAIISNIIGGQSGSYANLRAITLDHINSALIQEAGMTLLDLLKSNGDNLRGIFNQKYLQQVSIDLR